MAYKIRERAVMIALAALGGSAPNAVLKNTFKLDLSGQKNKALKKAGLVEVQQARKGGPITFALTENGWHWVEYEMEAQLPDRAGSAGGALYALLGALKGPAQAAGGLRALLAGTAPKSAHAPQLSGDLRQQVRDAYRALAKRPQDWVQLRDLRPRLAGAAKTDVDSTLKRMLLDKEINLTLNEDQGALTQADRDAAIRIGVDDMHMLSMG
ncbi:MAG: hypothetical protein MRY64_12655 [Hyphomonadaceae bacterium]|nr:hypothetical protein [Hyphomonadaceae bacterium]